MKKSLLYMAAAAVVSLGFTACSPEEYEGADPNKIPTMDGVDFNPTVDQETNTMVATIAEKEGCYPIWNVDGVYYSSLPTMSWSNTEAGTHTIELRLGNRNGFSKASIKKTFTFNETKVDFSPIFKRLCDKDWRIDYDEVGHMGCGESHTDGSNWWAAGVADKKDWGVYDDRIKFTEPGLKGGVYLYNPGEGGTVYCNKDVATYGQYNTNDGNDYMAPVEAQTSTFTIKAGTWTDKDGNVQDCNFLEFPAGTLLPYVPNDAALNENNRWRIEGITATRLALVNDLEGSIAWRLVFTTKDEVKAFEGFNYGADSNMWLGVDNGSMPYSFHYYYAPGWAQIGDPTCTHEGAEWNWILPEATTDQWQAQCPIKPEGLRLTTSKTYDFSCIINANCDLPGVTVKLTDVNTGDNYVFVERVPVEAGKDYVFYLSDVNNLSEDADCELFFDFGGNPANADITVRNITLKDHAIDDGTVLPSDEPGGNPDAPVMDWDPASAANLWTPVESGEAFISVTPWFADNGWGQIADPEWNHKDGVWEVIVPEGMGGSQWQGQFPINTTLTASGSKKYNFYCVVEADNDCPGITIKLTQTDEADGTKHDNNFFFDGRHEVKADVPFVYKAEAVALKEGTDAHALSLFFDLGGAPAGTHVKISKIYFEEATVLSYDDPNNLWRSVDEGTNFISVTPWFADNGWGQIGDPAWSHNGKEWSLIIPEGMGGSQWQGQFPINTMLTAKGDKAYNFSCIVECDEDCPGVTIKVTQTDEADGTKHDDNFFFDGRHEVKADVPFKYVAKGVKLAKGTDAHALSLFFDFGGTPAGANVKIHDIIFEEAE